MNVIIFKEFCKLCKYFIYSHDVFIDSCIYDEAIVMVNPNRIMLRNKNSGICRIIENINKISMEDSTNTSQETKQKVCVELLSNNGKIHKIMAVLK